MIKQVALAAGRAWDQRQASRSALHDLADRRKRGTEIAVMPSIGDAIVNTLLERPGNHSNVRGDGLLEVMR